MIKKIFFFLVLIGITNCGYNPLYLKTNETSFYIKDYQIKGNKKIGRKIISALQILDKVNYKKKAYEIIIDSESKIDKLSKDIAGNVTVYKTTITVEIELIEKEKIIKKKQLSTNFTYNNIDNKFDLSQYQKSIEKNLTNKIIDELKIFLNF
ncbi:hypothetical protein [Candidatus Pelagibacter sp. Uisw_134_02]|uniref:hypothetical protein n=1 Tax=Candidatus Pelagibacter sp. Uisw_134_02 TaxID=3230990 RepID=UPI0039EBC6BC